MHDHSRHSLLVRINCLAHKDVEQVVPDVVLGTVIHVILRGMSVCCVLMLQCCRGSNLIRIIIYSQASPKSQKKPIHHHYKSYQRNTLFIHITRLIILPIKCFKYMEIFTKLDYTSSFQYGTFNAKFSPSC